ncbi:serine/threonine kinase 16 [Exophiala viscosa]|uniref:serine/threonine kinase 16 n=1 Tax=Exophiala viscosa TaxID=2486360 RepID=UPI002196ACBD|nr:serine/threonine kinase 16 [Exophiala viscosa]
MDRTVEHKDSPGTVTLVDVAGTIHAKHSRQRKDIVLDPAPSADPEDPLNWSPARKWRATLCALFYTWCVCVSSSSCFSVFTPINEASGISFTKLNEGTGYMYLLFGWGLLLWQPLALTYGRRGVYLISLLGTSMINIWAGYAKDNPTWIATRILIGFFGAPSEALCEVTMADLWFTHERGTYMGLYVIALYGGQWGAVPAGFINDSMGWPWVLFFCAILNAIGFTACFFFMEETMYVRSSPAGIATGSAVAAAGASDDETVPREKKGADAETGLAQDVSPGKTYPVRTYWQKLSPFVPLNGRPNHFWKRVLSPIRLWRFPGILFGGFIHGCYLCWFAQVNAVVSIFLGGPPYSWAADVVGLTYLAELIGTYLAGYCAGKLADLLSICLARRNGGIMEPEFRLWLYATGCIITPFGLLLLGVGYAHGLSWVALVFGMGMIGFVGPAAGSLAVSYIVDCYREIAGEALIAVILIRNTMNFGFNYGVTPWLDNMGAQNMFILAAVVASVTTASFLIMIKWGKQWREANAATYWKYVSERVDH